MKQIRKNTRILLKDRRFMVGRLIRFSFTYEIIGDCESTISTAVQLFTEES